MNRVTCGFLAAVLGCALANTAAAEGLKEGTPDLKSAGALAFTPDGVLFVGDSKSAAVFAIETGDTKAADAKASLRIDGLEQKVAALLGTKGDDILINDIATNPASGNVYISVSRGKGPDGQPAIVKVDAAGQLALVSLEKVPFAKAQLPNPPEDKVISSRRGPQNRRLEAITDLAFFEGKVIVSGLTSEEFASNLRQIPYPFSEADAGASVEIYHGAHGKYETQAPVRTFVPFNISGEPHLLAAYTCTPLVKFPVSQLSSGSKVQGTTVAELGNRNRPLDMIVYKQGDKDFVLMANSARGVMKISTENIERPEGITEPVEGTLGQTYETIKDLQGVVQLDRYGDDQAVVLVEAPAGAFSLQTIALP